MIAKFLNSKTKTVTFAAALLALAALISRILGLFRDNLLANLLSKSQGDIYFAAFRIPDFVYGVLITGGLVAAFLPVFSTEFKKGKKEAQNLTNNVLTFFLIALVLISAILAIFAPLIVKFIVPGFSPPQKALTVTLTRIMFLSPILLGISAIFSGILHYFNLFLAYALAPIFYNLGIIMGILFFLPILGLAGLAWGVILGAAFHLIIQLPPALKAGFSPRFSFKPDHPGLRKIFKLAIPRTLSSAAWQINLIVITAIASILASGSIRIFNLANNLQGVAIGLIGIPFATAAFPLLSRYFAAEKKAKFSQEFSAVFSQILYLIIPLSLLTFLLRAQIVRLIFGTAIFGEGFFGWWETRLTAASLGVFALALFAATLIPFLARTFFSSQETKIPVKIALSAMALNIFLCFSFTRILSFPNFFRQTLAAFLEVKDIENITVLGLSLALSVSAIFQFFLLSFFLKRKIKNLKFQEISQSFLKILLSAVLMAPLPYLTLQIFPLILDTRTVLGLLLQTVSAASVAVFAFYLFSTLFKCREPKIIWLSIKNQFK